MKRTNNVISSSVSKSSRSTRAPKSSKGSKKRRNKKLSRWLLISIVIGLVALVGRCLFKGQGGHHGIDVSRYQGTIDWQKLADEGEVEFVFVKATEGRTYNDPTYKTNREGARAQGIPVGAYHFFTTTATGEAQFSHFRKVVGKNIDLKPVLDLEANGGKITDLGKYHKEVTAFIEGCREYYGCRPIIYASPSFIKDNKLQKVVEGCPYWMAWYTHMPFSITSHRQYLMLTHPGTQAIMWQYSEKGHHRGIKGYVDMNECWEMPTIRL